jgi:putative hydrolase
MSPINGIRDTGAAAGALSPASARGGSTSPPRAVPPDLRSDLNASVAVKLDEIAALLRSQGANPFRVRAYERGAASLRRLEEPVADVLARGGVEVLERLPEIGQSLARSIRDIVRFGYSPMLQRLRGDADPVRLLASVPGIGRRFAARLHDELNLETLEDLEAAAHDGRLERLVGFGPKRLAGVRAVLAERLGRVHRASAGGRVPSVGELLSVDREYRASVAAHRLPVIAPRRFNPEGRRWLPILHTTRAGRHYTALFSNTARAHQLGRTHDWVVIYCDRVDSDGQWTVVTGWAGALRGRRIVRGRERECERYYRIGREPQDRNAVRAP